MKKLSAFILFVVVATWLVGCEKSFNAKNSDVGVHQCRDGADGSGTMLGTGEMWLARGAAHNPAALIVRY
jgi:hypothetical protein